MDAVYPAQASALARGRRLRRAAPRQRHRTTPVTFAEIKEVDEESSETEVQSEERKRRPDVLEPLEERLGRQFAEFRRRRARPDLLRERELESPPPAPPPHAPHAPLARAGSEPAALHRDAAAT
ncbi:hypothetical protein PYW07_006786 [Mythimna separata]|uniref:Uncharacterized protein n=1 Tax=Mythimna separata TaxID=271217 RepID=A0AAD7YXC6_MYTSE|nr:hypothetical protein PYW07_006786 [Mythimna separata]